MIISFLTTNINQWINAFYLKQLFFHYIPSTRIIDFGHLLG